MNSHRTRSVQTAAAQAKRMVLPIAAAIILGAAVSAGATAAANADSAQNRAAIALDVHSAQQAVDRSTHITYTVSLRNIGGADAAGTRLVAALAAGIDSARWTCSGGSGARCPSATGSGPIDATIAFFPAGGRLLYTVDASIAATPPAFVKNAVRAELPNGARCADGQTAPCRAHLDLATGPRVETRLVANTATPGPGASIVYTLTVRNSGSIDGAGTVVRDPVPFGLSQFDWTCTGSAPCPRSAGQGALLETLAHFPAGSSLTYTIKARVVAQPPSRIIHIATANPPYSGSCGDGGSIHAPTCVARAINLVANHCASSGAPCAAAKAEKSLAAGPPSLVVTQSSASYDPNTSYFTYLVDITNPSDSATSADGTQFEMPIPAGISSFDDWSCFKNGNPCTVASGSGALTQTLDSLQPGDTCEFAIDVTKDPSTPSTITSDVTVTPPSPFVCEADGSAPPCLTQFSLSTTNVATLSLSAGASVVGALPGDTVQYTVSLQNLLTQSGAAADGTTLTFPIPAGIQSWSWTCSAVGTADCPSAAGSGPLNETIANLGAGGSVAYTIAASIGSAPPAVIDSIATATGPAGLTTICIDTGSTGPCQSEAFIGTVPLIAVENYFEASQAVAGNPITYSLRVANIGAPLGGSMHISDPSPTGLENITWTCEGSSCPSGSSGSGPIEQDIAGLQPDGFVLYSINATVATPAPVVITRTATATPPAGSLCVPPSDQGGPVLRPTAAPQFTPPPCVSGVSVYSSPYLKVTKTANKTQLVPGDVVTYTVTVSNSGVVSQGARLLDPMPAGVDNVDWVCASFGDVVCPAPSGSGDLDQTFGSLFEGSQYVYTLTAHVSDNATGSVTNTATIVPDPGAACDGSCDAVLTLPMAPVPAADLQVTKTADRSIATPATAIIYTVTVRNNGNAPAVDTLVSDALPVGISSFNWTCFSPNAECPNASGSGAISQTVPSLSGQVQYTVTAMVGAAATGTIINTATAAPADSSNCLGTNCTASVSVPIEGPNVVVTNTSSVAAGAQAPAGKPIHWTVTVSNDGAPTTGPLTITDTLPPAIESISLSADPDLNCTPSNPAAGQSVVCKIATGFTGSAQLVIDAVVSVDASGVLSNNVSASGPDQPTCNDCSSTTPIAVATDVALGNARAFSAAGINGYLFDLVNVRGAVPVTLTASPASAVQLFGNYSTGCSTSGDGDNVVVSCPPPPPALNLDCVGATCSIDTLAAGETVTVFVAANGSAALTIQATAANDVVTDNNTLQIPPSSGAP